MVKSTANISNGISLADQFAGADAGAKIVAAIAALPSAGGTVDARGLQGDQTISSDVFTEVTKSITLLLGAGTFVINANITIPANFKLDFAAGASLAVATARTVTLRASILASDTQSIFSGLGTLTFARPYSYVPITWFGAAGNCSTDDSVAFNKTIKAVQNGGGGHIYIPPVAQGKCYLINNPLNFTENIMPIWVEGQGDSVPVGAPSLPTAGGSVLGANTGGVLFDLTGAVGGIHFSKFGADSRLAQTTNPSQTGILLARKIPGPTGGCNLCTFDDLHLVILQNPVGSLPLTAGIYVYSTELQYFRNVAVAADYPLVVSLGNPLKRTSPNVTIATGDISATRNTFINMELWSSGQGPGLWLSSVSDVTLIGSHIWSGVQGTPYPVGAYNAAVRIDGNNQNVHLEIREEGFPSFAYSHLTIQSSEFTGSWNPAPSPAGPLWEFTDSAGQIVNSTFNVWPGGTSPGALYDSSQGTPPLKPRLLQTAGGALGATTYYVKTTYTGNGEESAPSPESSLAINANTLLTVASPAGTTNVARGYNIYVSTTAGSETKQNSIPIAIGTAWTEATSGLFSGAALPSDYLVGLLSVAGDDFNVGGASNALNLRVGSYVPSGLTPNFRNLRVLHNPTAQGAGALPTITLVGAAWECDLMAGAIQGTGAVTLAAGGRNHNVTLTPSGTGTVTARNFSTSVNTLPTVSSTPTFDASLGNTQVITLTGNVTSSKLSHCTVGQWLVFDIVQGSEPWTFTWPTNVLNAGIIGTALGRHNIQTFYCDGTNARAIAPMLTNQN